MDEIILPPLTEAQKNCDFITEKVKEIYKNYVQLAILLVENRDKAHWQATSASGFKEFTQMLNLEWTQVTRLVTIGELVLTQKISREDATEIGYSKMCYLLPRYRKGEVSTDLIELAKNCPQADLRKELGYKVPDDGSEEYLNCPRCGVEITLHKGMIRHR